MASDTTRIVGEDADKAKAECMILLYWISFLSVNSRRGELLLGSSTQHELSPRPVQTEVPYSVVPSTVPDYVGFAR